MGRRYLTDSEIEFALGRGKEVEAFLGGFENDGLCIRWISLATNGKSIVVSVWEAIDRGSEDYLDVYSFPPANGVWDMPAKVFEVSSISEIKSSLGVDVLNFVNYGVVQDEYGDYKSTIA